MAGGQDFIGGPQGPSRLPYRFCDRSYWLRRFTNFALFTNFIDLSHLVHCHSRLRSQSIHSCNPLPPGQSCHINRSIQFNHSIQVSTPSHNTQASQSKDPRKPTRATQPNHTMQSSMHSHTSHTSQPSRPNQPPRGAQF